MAPLLPSDATVIDLRGLEPAPERLLEVFRRSAVRPGEDLVVDWGARFPWSLDAALRRVDAFPEDLVAAAARVCAQAPCRLSAVVRSVLPVAYTSRSSYRHLERARRRAAGEWEAALGKLASDLVEDLVSLMPELAGVVVAPECEHVGLIERACSDAGISVRAMAGEAQPGHTDGGEAERTGGVEERLCEAGHPACLDRPFAIAHEELRRWRTRGWELVADAHERLVGAEADGPRRDRELAGAVSELGRHLRAVRAVRVRLEETYAGLVPDGAVERLLRGIDLPLREQHGHLAARARAVRTLR